MDSWGRCSLQFELPGIDITIKGLSKPQHETLKRIYSSFVTDNREISLTETVNCQIYRLESMLFPSADMLSAEDGQYSPLLIRENDYTNLTGCNFKAGIAHNNVSSQASLGVVKEEELTKPSVIENFLRIYAAYRTVQLGGLLLHSAGLVFNNQAYIFPGRSNAGKTTLTRKAHKHGARVLSDDINLLLPCPEGYQAYAVPFTGEFGRTLDHSGGRDAYPVAGIILLRQGSQLTIESMSRADGVATLLTGCPFVNDDPQESDNLFDAVINLVSAVPVIRLTSSREDGIDSIMAAVTQKLQSMQNERGKIL